jgi:hypothetical protein
VPTIAANLQHTQKRRAAQWYVTLLIGKSCPVADRSKTCSNVIYHLNLIERSKCKQSCNSGRWLRLSAPANYLVPRRACSYGAWYILW